MIRIFILYAISGFISLGYQITWFRVFTDWFGSTNLTFALVVCNFIGGLAAGALLSRRITNFVATRANIADPLRVYGLIEILVGATVLLTVFAEYLPADLFGAFPYTLTNDIWQQSAGYRISQIAIATACVFIPCLFMGATFPLLCHVFIGEPKGDRFPAALYAWNTLGACLGVLACQFIFILWLGYKPTFWLMSGLNVLLGLYFVVTGGAPAGAVATAPVSIDWRGQARYGTLLTFAVLSGFLAGALEGDMFKRISFMLGSSPGATMSFISFWAIAAIFLASALVNRVPQLKLLHIKLAYVCALVYYFAMWRYHNALVQNLWPFSLPELLRFTGLFVFLPYFFISLLLPWVCNRLQAEKVHIGLTYGLNTAAFCIGLLGFTLIAPKVNIFYSTKLLMLLLLIGTVALLVTTEKARAPRLSIAGFVAAFALACIFAPAEFDRSYFLPTGDLQDKPIRAMKSNGTHTTFVMEEMDPRGNLRLFFGSHSMSGTDLAPQSYMRLMAHMPLLSQRRPRSALLICFGVGNTASAIAAHSNMQQIDIVDLNDKIFETAPEFSKFNNEVYRDPRVRMIHDDGRGFLRMTDQTYDLITSEPPPPLAPGVYRLYSREYYESALAHLSPQGIMTQWLPINQLPQEAADLIISTFIDVFEHSLLFTGWDYEEPGSSELILMGSPAPINLNRIVNQFFDDPAVVEDLRRIGIKSGADFLNRIVATDDVLRRNYGGLHIISDQRNDLEHTIRRPPDWAAIRLN